MGDVMAMRARTCKSAMKAKQEFHLHYRHWSFFSYW
ncbi:Uncharacterized protein TCM_003969 isoform 2, partial [Theobroma cacao]